jgi:hypothetical protein
MADRVIARYGLWRIFATAAAAAFLLLLGLGSRLSFRADEWAYIVDRSLTVDGLFRPHNEHLVALHVLVYRAMVEMIGIGSYLPYQIVLLTAHVAAAAGLLALLRSFLPAPGALAGAIVFLFLGSGVDNLIWAFQSGYVAAVGLGIWALVLHKRPWIAGTLLLLAMGALSSVALFFVLPLAVLVRARIALLPALIAFGIWYVAAGPTVEVGGGALAPYAVAATGSVFGGLFGLDWPTGIVIALAAGSLVVVGSIRRRSLEPVAIAGLLGLVSEIGLTSLGRAHLGADQAVAARYIYSAVPFIFMLVPAVPAVPRNLWTVGFVLALLGNVLALPRGIAFHATLLEYEQTIPIEQRVAPFR